MNTIDLFRALTPAAQLLLTAALCASVALTAARHAFAEPLAAQAAGAANRATTAGDDAATKPLRIGAVVTEYRRNSHADMIVGRLIQTATLDDQGRTYPAKVVSLYTDQVPENDTSRELAKKHDFPIAQTVREALTLGGDKLAVDAVLLVAEHGKYERSETGNIKYPKRRLFEAVVDVFKETGQVVPVFVDKHVSDNWDDINWMWTTAREMNIPLMAGSSLPVAWRDPAADVSGEKPLEQIIVLSYHTLDAYGFHAIEMAQTLAEQRPGGETGIASVQTLSDEAVWQAFENPSWDPKLFDLAFEALPRHRLGNRTLKEAVKNPSLMIINYEDGLKAYIFTLNGVVGHWTAGWKYKDGQREATFIALQDGRPYYHFALLTDAIVQMFQTGEPTYPAERTVLSSGALDALLISKLKGGEVVPTPYLDIDYSTDWRWQQPDPAPPVQSNP